MTGGNIMPANASEKTVAVWDPLVRTGHWLIVACFAIAYITGGEPEWLHTLAGYTIAVAVIVRVIWGFAGPQRARFSDFLTGPGAAAAYLKDLIAGHAKRHLGHSPAGGLMTVTLLAMLALVTLTGMATLAAEDGEGPLAGIVAQIPKADPAIGTAPAAQGEDDDEDDEQEDESAWKEVHEFFVNVTLLLVLLHVGGVVLASVRHRENLARAMVTGRKRG
jgi:cytochrome b